MAVNTKTYLYIIIYNNMCFKIGGGDVGDDVDYRDDVDYSDNGDYGSDGGD